MNLKCLIKHDWLIIRGPTRPLGSSGEAYYPGIGCSNIYGDDRICRRCETVRFNYEDAMLRVKHEKDAENAKALEAIKKDEKLKAAAEFYKRLQQKAKE